MDMVFFGYDLSIPALQAALSQGHRLRALYSFPCDQRFNHNQHIKDLAHELNADVYEDKISAQDIQARYEQGAQIFFAAGYPYKIPPQPSDCSGLKLHTA
jgi:hypothetical protein